MDKRKKELLKISDEIKKLIDDKQKELSLKFPEIQDDRLDLAFNKPNEIKLKVNNISEN